ncbi:condensation domain-containing protein [Actinoplanes couchii]|uniref:Carrier domain-containing protein n=1 Tax=Actinoplanes couchii TaxID=403638 RepID=A0ABQ3XTC2_9ACTN|nr:condensation domain-containing protein [Actinoplanes couchii]MDR6324146.1 amino acid adenylation domain-containing protein/non-ribosomal peptide synthase protein (TIGR01720 family) [Actinoplanes couchii]GID61764.1 hypothetical protein Aco03nite_101680 [Actinoplanes couchii]
MTAIPTYEPGSMVWELLRAQASARPDAVAVRADGRDVTYADLVSRAGRLAHTLSGDAPVVTGVHLPRSVEFVVAMLAAMRTGCYVPLDPALPDARREQLIRHAGVTRVVTGDDSGPRNHGARELRPVRPDEVAYVLHTSGSTGVPKGVTVTHGALAEHLLAFGARVGITAGDRTLLFAQPTADVHVEQVLAPLVHGATLVLHPPGLPDVPRDFLRFLHEERVTVANVPAGYWRLLVGEPDPVRPAALRTLIVGSDVMPAEVARRWREGPLGSIQLFNAYGPTETVITASLCAVDATAVADGTSVPLGEPLDGRTMHVLGPDLRPADVGEVHLGGILAQGYLGDPRRTAAVFVPSPFAAGERLYRTGDQARVRPDGTVEFLGRVDRQVKIRGFRVELGAIESEAMRHPAVTDCVAVAVPDAGGERRITLLAVLSGPAGDLLAALREALPPAAVPHRLQPAEALPLTAAGKIDHAAAAALVEAAGAGADDTAGDGRTEPADPLEAALLAHWRAALNVPVGPDDDFIGAGGDSMTSLTLACQAPQLGVTIRPRDIFETGTVRALARRIREGRTTVPAPDHPVPENPAVLADAGLTPALHWLIDRLGGVPADWGQYVVLALADGADIGALQRSVATLAYRFPALRTAIRQSDGEWRTATVEPAEDHWTAVEIPAFTGTVLAGIRERATAWLDPATGRHLHATLLTGPGGERRLLLVAHHAAVDVVSWRLLMNDLDTTYHLVRSGWGAPEVAPAPAVADWVRELHGAVAAGAFDVEREHWSRAVAAVPADAPADGGLEGGTRTVTVAVPLGGVADPAEIVLAASLSAWQRWSGRDRCVVEMESPGRDATVGAAGYDVVGWLTAMYPVPVDLGGEPDKNLAALQSAIAAVPGDGSGYGVLRYLHPDPAVRDSLRLPGCPDVSANFRGRTTTERTALLAPDSTVQAGPARGAGLRRPCPVVVDGWVEDDTLTVALELDGRAVDEIAAAALQRDLEDALRTLLAPRTRELPLTPAQEGILFHAVQSADPESYVGQIVVAMTGELNRDAFTAAWRAASRANPSARTSFAWRRQMTPSQRIVPDAELPLRWVDGTSWTGAAERLAAELAAGERGTPFDLENGPLLRVTVAALADGRHLVVVTHHHLVFDGWSMNLLVGDLMAAYAELCAGRPARLAIRESAAELVARAPSRESDDFWNRHMAGARPTRLVDPARQRSGIHRETTLRLTGADWDRIRADGRDRRLAPAVYVHLAWASTLRVRLGQDDVTFGTVMSGRDARIPGIEAASGMLINTLPLRVRFDVPGDIAADLLALQERQGASLVEVRREAGIGSRDVLFDHLLDFGTSRTMVATPAAGVAGLHLRPLHGFERTNYGITITAVAGAELELSVNHDDGLLPVPEAADLLADFARAIRSVTSSEGDGQ